MQTNNYTHTQHCSACTHEEAFNLLLGFNRTRMVPRLGLPSFTCGQASDSLAVNTRPRPPGKRIPEL